MSPVYAKCLVHGSFESTIIDADNVFGMTIVGVPDYCPTCGRPAQTMQGTFNLYNGAVEMLSGPDWTREMLASIRDSVAEAKAAVQRAGTDSEVADLINQLRSQVRLVNGKMDSLIAENAAGKSKEWTLFFLGTLLTILTWAIPAVDAGHLTEDAVKSMVQLAIEQRP
jgi:hypothetical protein